MCRSYTRRTDKELEIELVYISILLYDGRMYMYIVDMNAHTDLLFTPETGTLWFSGPNHWCQVCIRPEATAQFTYSVQSKRQTDSVWTSFFAVSFVFLYTTEN